MEIFLVPILLISLLYVIFQSVHQRRSPFLTMLLIMFFAGTTALGAFFYGAVKASYGGQKEWQQERAFFLGIFIQKLEASGDLNKAAKMMQSEEVKKQTLAVIQKIVHSFHFPMCFYLSTGGTILLLAALLLCFKKFSEKKYFPYLLVLLVLLGSCLGARGIYYLQYATGTERQLKNFLRCQQKFLMTELAETETALTIPEIIRITSAEAGRVQGFGYGQSLPEMFRKNQTPRKEK